jgi:hypothetical protein
MAPTDEISTSKAPVESGDVQANGQAQPRMSTGTTLERLDASEKAILDLYRRATDKGKVMIRNTAMAVPKADD